MRARRARTGSSFTRSWCSWQPAPIVEQMAQLAAQAGDGEVAAGDVVVGVEHLDVGVVEPGREGRRGRSREPLEAECTELPGDGVVADGGGPPVDRRFDGGLAEPLPRARE